MGNRHVLHLKHLEEFTEWLESKGWEICETKGSYEKLRARKAGRKHPLIVYGKLEIKEHLTVRDMDSPVILAFFWDRKKGVRHNGN